MTLIVERTFDVSMVDALVAEGVQPVMARVLAARGITQSSELEASLARLIPPDQLTNANQMAALLADAILQNKSLLVVGDYDCDGATATAVAIRSLRR